jgi:hypothetical protein
MSSAHNPVPSVRHCEEDTDCAFCGARDPMNGAANQRLIESIVRFYDNYSCWDAEHDLIGATEHGGRDRWDFVVDVRCGGCSVVEFPDDLRLFAAWVVCDIYRFDWSCSLPSNVAGHLVAGTGDSPPTAAIWARAASPDCVFTAKRSTSRSPPRGCSYDGLDSPVGRRLSLAVGVFDTF